MAFHFHHSLSNQKTDVFLKPEQTSFDLIKKDGKKFKIMKNVKFHIFKKKKPLENSNLVNRE